MVACRLSFRLDAKAIIVPASRMQTVLRIIRYRPKAPVLVVAQSEALTRQLAIVWGTVPLQVPAVTTIEECVARAKQWLFQRKLASPGDPVVVLSASETSGLFSDTLQFVRL